MRIKSASIALTLSLNTIVLASILTTTQLTAQTPLHTFGSDIRAGVGPWSGVIFDSRGNLYGTTIFGGDDNVGTVFELVPRTGHGWVEKRLYSFSNKGGDGQSPQGTLIFDSAGNLYGTTSAGGSDGVGTVFELMRNPDGSWTEKILHSFLNNGVDGQDPIDGLVLDSAGNLYGTTFGGGEFVVGTVFELSPTSSGPWSEQLLHAFSPNVSLKDGNRPRGNLVIDTHGNLYGTTLLGGLNFDGTVYELSPSAGSWNESILYSFNAYTGDGLQPVSGVVFDSSGNIYGTTTAGGSAGMGTVFELTPSANGTWAESILYNFASTSKSDGSNPVGSLVFDSAGNLYGTTLIGGTGTCTTTGGCGIVYELMHSGSHWSERVIHNFNNNGTDGYFPIPGVVLDSADNVYGTTYYGGAFNDGTVYAFRP